MALERGLPICGLRPNRVVNKSMTFAIPHIGHSRHGLFSIRLDCQSNAKPSEKDHDLPGIRTRDLWSSSQHTLHHLGRHCAQFTANS
jgi:hypothetical protein